MGKRIITQRRGRGTSTYTAHSFRYLGEVKHRDYDDIEKGGVVKGIVIDIVKCPGHTAPLADIRYENGEKRYLFAPIGVRINDAVESGFNAKLNNGNTLPLKQIPDGTSVYNIESFPGDGGIFCRTAGTSARVLGTMNNKVIVELPSKKKREFDILCRATIGVLAGTGRKDKPLLKAGNVHWAMRARGKLYPRTSGVAMNAVDHPFGSGRGRHVGKPKVPPRNAPPGRNVGLLRAKRTGRKKR